MSRFDRMFQFRPPDGIFAAYVRSTNFSSRLYPVLLVRTSPHIATVVVFPRGELILKTPDRDMMYNGAHRAKLHP